MRKNDTLLRIIIIIVSLCLLLIACTVFEVGDSPYTPSDSKIPVEVIKIQNTRPIHRFIDREAEVVCYTHYEALSCLPLSDTALSLWEN